MVGFCLKRKLVLYKNTLWTLKCGHFWCSSITTHEWMAVFCVSNEYTVRSFMLQSQILLNLWLPSLILLTRSCCAHTAVSDIPLLYLVTLFQVAADDLDQGQNGQVTYSIRSSSMSGLFKIDPLTGSVSTAAIMDREIWTQTK